MHVRPCDVDTAETTNDVCGNRNHTRQSRQWPPPTLPGMRFPRFHKTFTSTRRSLVHLCHTAAGDDMSLSQQSILHNTMFLNITSYHSSGAPCCLSIVTHLACYLSIASFNAVLFHSSLRLASILSSLSMYTIEGIYVLFIQVPVFGTYPCP